MFFTFNMYIFKTEEIIIILIRQFLSLSFLATKHQKKKRKKNLCFYLSSHSSIHLIYPLITVFLVYFCGALHDPRYPKEQMSIK